MKNLFTSLRFFVGFIAFLMFAAGIVLTVLGVYEFVIAFVNIGEVAEDFVAGSIAVGLLQSVDLFLISIVFFIFSLGILTLFNTSETVRSVELPEWLRVKNFMQLKIILWESILTTLVISFLAGLARKKIQGIDISVASLFIPASILLISLSLYFLKKGEKE